jgi:hypothetical protein
VIIWSEAEELKNKSASKKMNTSSQNAQKPTLQWHKKTSFVQKEQPNDIKFAPKHLGLLLAVALSNGKVILFKCSDINNLTSSFSEL